MTDLGHFISRLWWRHGVAIWLAYCGAVALAAACGIAWRSLS